MVITTRPINTTLSDDHYKRAKAHGIGWSEAMALGIDILNNDNYHKEKELLKEIGKLKGTLKVYQKRLMELRKDREEREQLEKELTKTEIRFLKGIEERLDKGAELEAILRNFNYDFKKTISMNNFKHLIKKYGAKKQ